MSINVKVLKNILELDEEKFSECKEMFKDLKELMKDETFSLIDLEQVYYYAEKKDEMKLLFYKKKYTRFIKKYYSILHTLNSDKNLILYGIIFAVVNLDYDYVKQNYDNKDEVLKRLNKLLELNILEFKALSGDENFYNADSHFSDERELFFEIEKYGSSRKGLFTDGDLTFKDDNGYFIKTGVCKIEYHNSLHDIYPVEVANANYVLQWKISQRHFGDEYGFKADMKIKNLMFDIDSLPTYEELQKGVFPKKVADHIAYREDIAVQKMAVVDTIYNVDDMGETIKRLLSGLEYYTEQYEITKDREEAKAIKAKLGTIKELYTDVVALKEAVADECFENELMDEQELEKALTKKRG